MSALERHYTVAEIAALWELSEDCIRAIFRHAPGVLKLARPERRNKRGYTSLRIPESVLQRTHERLRGKAGR